MSVTKRRIVEAAIQLFNESGIANVRLQQIADEVGISIGNLAYHYNNKEAIVLAVCEQIGGDLRDILSEYQKLPNLLDFDRQLSKVFDFHQAYAFYYEDSSEIRRFYPSVKSQQETFGNKFMAQTAKRLDYHRQLGIVRPEPVAGLYGSIVRNIWLVVAFWPVQRRLFSQDPYVESHFKEAVWAQLFPHLTEAGAEQFRVLIQPSLTH